MFLRPRAPHLPCPTTRDAVAGAAACAVTQFFLTLGPTPWVDGKHTIFGRISSGMKVGARRTHNSSSRTKLNGAPESLPFCPVANFDRVSRQGERWACGDRVRKTRYTCIGVMDEIVTWGRVTGGNTGQQVNAARSGRSASHLNKHAMRWYLLSLAIYRRLQVPIGYFLSVNP